MRLRTISVCLCILLLSGFVAAQSVTGSIAGTVKDPSGAVVPNAKVTLTDLDKGLAVRSAVTGGSGEFSFDGVPVGNYSVTVEAPNFQKFVQSPIVLHVNDRLTVSPTLTVGAGTQQITVEATAEQINLQSATAAGVVTGTQIRELSLANRNFLELIFTLPGTSNSGTSAFFPGVTAPGGVGTNLVTVSVNGGRREENNFLVDGSDNVDRGGNLTLLSFPSVDSIAEFRVLRGVYDPESGRTAAAQINAITRSGTNTFHGGVYEFFRNDALNANNYFNKRTQLAGGKPNLPPVLRYNDFGGTFGGPVFIPHVYNRERNKTFFFFSEEVRRIVVYAPATGSVPTSGMASGNFNHTVCTKWANSNGTPGTCQAYGTSIPQSQWDPIAAAYIKDVVSKFPTPNAPTATNPFQFITTLRGVFNFHQEILRVDHVFNSKFSVNGKWARDASPTHDATGLFNGGYPIDNIGTTEDQAPAKQYYVSGTWTPTPSFLVEGGWKYAKQGIFSTAVGAMASKNATTVDSLLNKILPFPNPMDHVAGVTFTGGTALPGAPPYSPYNDFNTNITYYGNVTKVVGTHTLKFGAIYYHYNKHENADLVGAQPTGAFGFDSQNQPTATTTFNGAPVCSTSAGTCPFSYEQSFANFLLGQLNTFSQGSIDVTANVFDNQFEYFGQDTWRLRPNFTLTYGIRHSLFRQPYDASGAGGSSRLVNFDPSKFDPTQAPCILSTGSMDVKIVNGLLTTSACNPNYNPLNGMIYPNPPTFQGHTGVKSPYGSKVGKEYNRAIAPRIGFAWDPWGNGKTSVRAGYGMFYDSGWDFGDAELNIGSNPGFLTNLSVSRTTFSAPLGTSSTNCVAPNFANCALPQGYQSRIPVNYKSPYTQQWSLDLQRQFPQNWFLDLGYFGNNGIHLPGYLDFNQPGIGAYLKCTTASKCFAGPGASSNATAYGVDLSTGASAGCPVGLPCVNNSATTNKLNVLRPFTGYAAGRFTVNAFTSNYHSLQAQLQKHFSGSSLLSIAYTWSHGLTTDPADRNTGASIPQHYTVLKDSYGPSIGDRRHILTANFVYELPWLRAQQGFVGHVLGGWQFSGIQTFQTGLPLTATMSIGAACNAGTGNNCIDVIGGSCLVSTFTCKTNLIGDPNAHAPHSYSNWFNASAIVPPPYGQLTPGNESTGALRAPGYWQTDLSLFKNIKFTERFRGQFRLESFNAFNHTNPLAPNVGVTSTAFNTITAARDPRLVQLGLKLNF